MNEHADVCWQIKKDDDCRLADNIIRSHKRITMKESIMSVLMDSVGD